MQCCIRICDVVVQGRINKLPFETTLTLRMHLWCIKILLRQLTRFWNRVTVFLSKEAAECDIFSLININFCSALAAHVWLKVSDLIKVWKCIGSSCSWYVRRFSLLSLAKSWCALRISGQKNHGPVVDWWLKDQSVSETYYSKLRPQSRAYSLLNFSRYKSPIVQLKALSVLKSACILT